jgi:hypothetical protein
VNAEKRVIALHVVKKTKTGRESDWKKDGKGAMLSRWLAETKGGGCSLET